MALGAVLGIASLIKNLTSSGNSLSANNLGLVAKNLFGNNKNIISNSPLYKGKNN